MTTGRLIGIDIGTTTVKAALFAPDGSVLHCFARSHEMLRPEPGHAEQDPAAWLGAVDAALLEFAEAADPASVSAIGLTSQVNTHVFVDEGGRHLAPAITWQDGRCGDDAAALDGQVAEEQKMAWFGAPMPIDASHALARAAHMRRTAPQVYGRTRHILLPKDYCALHLTGQAVTDPISSIGLVDRDHAYIEDLFPLVEGARAKFASLVGLTAPAGTCRAGPFAGVPVFAGTMDAWAGMFGIGVVRDGDAMYLSGTSEVLGVLSNCVVPTPGVIVFPPYEGMRLHAAPTQSGGASLDWVSGLTGLAIDDALAVAAEVAPRPDAPLFLPHLQGERAPIWDIKARGAFAGLDAASGPGEMVRAVLEGVAFSARWAFDALEASSGGSVETVHLGGGGARSDLWCQIRADALNMTVRRVRGTDAGVLGAAVIAGAGQGVFASLVEAVDHLVVVDRTFRPDPEAARRAADRYGRFRELYEILKPIHHGL